MVASSTGASEYSRHARCANTTSKNGGPPSGARSPKRVFSPTSEKEFTYMIRSAGWKAHASHSGEPHGPSRASTSGRMRLNVTSASGSSNS